MTDQPQPRKRRGKAALIDPARVRQMVADGYSRIEVAEAHDVSTNAIDGICKDYGIRSPKGVPRRYKARAKPDKGTDRTSSTPVPNVPPQTAALIATGGRYADLRAWAQRWGTTEIKARQEWHALRLPVAKGGTA